jgi:hypothetical protein
MMSTYRTLNDYEMQHNAEVGLFTRSSLLGGGKKNQGAFGEFFKVFYFITGQ